MTRVNMGDRPSSAIAQAGLRNTAMEAVDAFPMESSIIHNNSYMDDIPGMSVYDLEQNLLISKLPTMIKGLCS